MLHGQVWLATELMALRLVMQRLLAHRAGLAEDPVAWLEDERARLGRITDTTIPGTDWAQSEALIGELQDKLDEIIDGAIETAVRRREMVPLSPAAE